MLQDVLAKKSQPALMRQVVAYHLMASHSYSQRRACRLTRQGSFDPAPHQPPRSTHGASATHARDRIDTRAQRLPARSVVLRRAGWSVGAERRLPTVFAKKAWRCDQSARGVAKMVVHRQARCQPKAPNEAWSLDFVHDQLSNGQKFRALTVVDVFSREALAIEVGNRLRGEHVVRVLNRLVRKPGATQSICLPTMAQRFSDHKSGSVGLSPPGPPGLLAESPASRPTTPTSETFNGSLRDECLNLHWFETLAEARQLIEAWQVDYNVSRPHMALGNIPPAEYALQARNQRGSMILTSPQN